MAATRTRCICRKFVAQVSAWDVDGYDIIDGDMIEAQAQTAHDCRVSDATLNDREHEWAMATGRCFRDYAEVILDALRGALTIRSDLPMTTMHGSTIHLTARQADTLAVILKARLDELVGMLDADDRMRARIERAAQAGITLVSRPLTPAVRTMYDNERHDIRAMLLEVTHIASV
jgi:hypothetical protein